MEGYNKNDPQEVRKFQGIAFEQFLAYAYLEKSDKAKYGSLLNNLRQQQSLKHDQYPKSIADASNVLNNHKVDNLGRRGQDKSKENDNKPKKDENIELSFAQPEGKCYCCGKTGHKSPKCNEKSKPREEMVREQN
jgi:hypothetical protein